MKYSHKSKTVWKYTYSCVSIVIFLNCFESIDFKCTVLFVVVVVVVVVCSYSFELCRGINSKWAIFEYFEYMGTLREGVLTVTKISAWILHRMRNVLDNICRENQNTHLWSVTFYFRKWCRLWDNVEKCGGARETPDNMAHARCMLNKQDYTRAQIHAHTVLPITFPRQQWFREHVLSVTLLHVVTWRFVGTQYVFDLCTSDQTSCHVAKRTGRLGVNVVRPVLNCLWTPASCFPSSPAIFTPVPAEVLLVILAISSL